MRKIKLNDKGVKLTDKDAIQMYLCGGKGRFILKSVRTDKQYEYKVKTPAKTIMDGWNTIPNPNYNEDILFVSTKIDDDFKFIGSIRIDKNTYYHSRKTDLNEQHESVKGIKWLLNEFENGKNFPNEMEFYHMGICSCCAKTLTTPGSIQIGIGPICFKRFGNIRLKKLILLKKRIQEKLTKNNITL